MSKRGPGATFGGGEERYGGPGPGNDVMDKPMKATDAQMARRKIALAKKGTRPGAVSRSASPFTPAPPGANASQPFAMNNTNANAPQSFTMSSNPNANAPQSFTMAQPAAPAGNAFAFSFGAGNSTQSATPSFNTTFPPPQHASTQAPSGMFNSTSQTPSFNFGSQQNGATPATNTSTLFGGFGQQPSASPQPPSQPQQNGFSQPPSSSLFNTAPQTPFTFGSQQTSQQQQNGGTPAPTNPFASFGKPPAESSNSTQSQSQQNGGTPAPTNPFASFGKPPAESSNSTQSQTQQNGGTPAPTNPFASFGKAPAESLNSTQSQTQQNGATPAANPFASFGKPPAENSKAAQSQTQQNGVTPAVNPFANFGKAPAENSTSIQSQTQQNGFSQPPSNNMFNTAPQTPFTFGSQQDNQQQQNGTAPATKNVFAGFGNPPQPEPEKANNVFAGFGHNQNQPEPEKAKANNVFSGFGNKKDESATSQNTFSGFGGKQPSPEKTANPFSGFGAKQPSPEKADNPFSGLNPQPPQNGGKTNTPGAMGQTAMDNGNKSGSETPQPNGQKTGLFGAPITAPSTQASGSGSIFDSIPKKAPSNFVFSSSDPKQVYREEDDEDADDHSKDTPATTSGLKASQAAQPKSAFGASQSEQQTPKAAPPKNLFNTINKPGPQPGLFTPAPAAPSAPPTTTLKVPATAPVTRTLTPAQQSPTSYQHPPLNDLKKSASLKNLNEGIIAHLKTEDPNKDWTSIFLFAARAAANIIGVPPPAEVETLSRPRAPPPGGSVGPSGNSGSSAGNGVPPASNGGGAPGNTKKRGFEADDESATQPPASEKQFKPSLSMGAPASGNSASLFGQTNKRMSQKDSESSEQPATEKRSKPSEPLYPALPGSASKTARLFAATLDKPKNTETADSNIPSGFKPSASLFSPAKPADSNTTSGFKPSASLFSPAKPTSPAKTTSPSKGSSAPSAVSAPSFVMPTFAPPASSGAFLSAFGANAKKAEEAAKKARMDEDYDSEDETKEEWEKRDREEQEKKRQKILDAAKAAEGFKVPNFGAPATASAPAAAGGFKLNFGASLTSAPTTAPAAAEDEEEGATEEDASAPREDLAGLLPEEKTENEVLKEFLDTKTSKFEETDQVGDDGKKTKKWVSRASGRLFVLKNKQNGKVRILCKAPQGRVLLNYSPLKDVKYDVVGKKKTMVQGMFMDHIHETPAALGKFIITAASADDATELAMFLMEGGASQ